MFGRRRRLHVDRRPELRRRREALRCRARRGDLGRHRVPARRRRRNRRPLRSLVVGMRSRRGRTADPNGDHRRRQRNADGRDLGAGAQDSLSSSLFHKEVDMQSLRRVPFALRLLIVVVAVGSAPSVGPRRRGGEFEALAPDLGGEPSGGERFSGGLRFRLREPDDPADRPRQRRRNRGAPAAHQRVRRARRAIRVGLCRDPGRGREPAARKQPTCHVRRAAGCRPRGRVSVVSDPVSLNVLPLQNLIISLYAPELTGAPSMHLFASQVQLRVDGRGFRGR